MSEARQIVLEFDSVTKWYGSVAALLDVSFQVRTEVVGLVGKNGVGKSTLMKLAVGLLDPSQGAVRVCGSDATTREARARIGFCPDFDRLYEPLSGVKFVSWMLRYHGVTSGEAKRRAEEVLTELGLAENMHRPIREYSKGMRQRVRLGQALAHRPQFVLLDEPMTGLDPVARAELSDLIRKLPQRGVGVLISSHVLHELEAVVDRVVLVHQGRLLADGKINDLRDQLPDRPHRLRLKGARLRELASQLTSWPEVEGVTFLSDRLEVSLSGHGAFYDRFTDLAGTWQGGIHELIPLDDDLAAVFGYLVE
ncbi:MAG: ABC-2 type transport system ATP-binding protein [Hyphomicrobiaceae bacterium]|jgi:ABC-2 type transport system ATP-binding protein